MKAELEESERLFFAGTSPIHNSGHLTQHGFVRLNALTWFQGGAFPFSIF